MTLSRQRHCKIKKEKQTKTTESPTISSRGQTTVIVIIIIIIIIEKYGHSLIFLYSNINSAVQSRSPGHCQTTTGKVQSSARGGTSSATVHSWQTTAGCSTLWSHLTLLGLRRRRRRKKTGAGDSLFVRLNNLYWTCTEGYGRRLLPLCPHLYEEH